jgi:phosphoglycerol geranylgeranyltransferase
VQRKGTIIAALIDPEEFSPNQAGKLARKVQKGEASVILIGGSTLADQNSLDDIVTSVKRHVTLPVILFPGNVTGISKHADAILFSSLLNSTNPYFIIGAQAIGAVHIRKLKLETIPMAYLVFGEESTTSFIGQVKPIPFSKPSIAVMYALAAQYMGMRAIYLEAGSGSSQSIPPDVIKAVRKYFDGLLIVGGGVTQPEAARQVSDAGADILVIGNLLESRNFEPKLKAIADAIKG